MARKPAQKAAKKQAAKKAPRKTAASKYKFIKVSKRNGICEIQFNRPDALNAINIEMAAEITDRLIKMIVVSMTPITKRRC